MQVSITKESVFAFLVYILYIVHIHTRSYSISSDSSANKLIFPVKQSHHVKKQQNTKKFKLKSKGFFQRLFLYTLRLYIRNNRYSNDVFTVIYLCICHNGHTNNFFFMGLIIYFLSAIQLFKSKMLKFKYKNVFKYYF